MPELYLFSCQKLYTPQCNTPLTLSYNCGIIIKINYRMEENPMWNTTILPILTSLIATGLGIFLVWLFNRKRQYDERANQITHILNEINDIKNKMANFFERLALETAKTEKLRDDIKEDVDNIKGEIQSIKGEIRSINEGIQSTNDQVTENRNMIYKQIGVVENLQNIISGNQNKVQDDAQSKS